MKFKKKLASFFSGRYGVDALAKGMLILYIFLAAVMIFVKNPILYMILQILSLILCILMFGRILSRNTAKRTAENESYLHLKKSIRQTVFLQRNKWKYRKTHIYRKCPHCHSQIKLPKKTGTHQCTCPFCRKLFDVHVK